MDRRRAAGCLLALAACFAFATAAPTASNQTALDLYDGAPDGCYYNFQHYGEGDRIMTNEPCLNCTCHNRMLMCYLRVCPFTKPIGQDCTIEKRADQCCPIVTCPDVPVDLLTSTTNSPAEYGATGLGKLDKYGCSINNKYFPEGSKVPSTPNKPCEHCYCIRNMTTCVMQECTLHVDGCTPIYHKDVCCPVRYSCDHPEGETPLLDDLSTTVRPTPGFLLTTTTLSPVTQISQDCVYDNQIFPDGALIKTEKACDHCYCMKGDIVCVVQECGTPMENEGKNCTALPPREGVCCPDTYICEGDEPTTGSYDGSEFTTNLPQETLTTLSPPRRTGSEGSGYRNEDTTPYTETPLKEIVEGSGDDEGLTDSTQPSDNLGSTYETEEPHEYISVTTKQPLVEQPEITTRAYTEPEITKSTTDKLQDQELGSGEEEKDQDQVPEISPATTVSTIQEETTIPYVHDVIYTKATEEPESQVKTSTTIPDRKEDTTILPQEDITSTKDKSETTDVLTSQETTVPAVDEALVPHISTIVPIVEDVDRKATLSEQSTLAPITGTYESPDTAKPEDYSPSSTAAPGVEEEISTEIQEMVTERSEKPEIELHPYPTVTASTPMLEEIEKETTEYSEKEPTSSEIVIPTVDSEFSTRTPSDKDYAMVTETSHKVDDDISDYITTISPTYESDYFTTPEPEKVADLDDHTLINVTPIADVIDKEATPSDKPTEIFEDKTEYYAPSTTSVSKIDQSQPTTTEPNKELNTIPGVEEHNIELSEPEKTTISELGEEITLGNRYNDSPNAPTSVTLAPADESPATQTTEMIKEVEEHKGTETITTSSDEFNKSTLSPTDVEDEPTELPIVEKSTHKPEEITLKPTDESTSRLDDAQTDQMNIVTTSSYDKFPETTVANIDENEIFNEPRIPGEGDCLLNGVTYRNESSVPSANKCLSDCKCISSIIKCDPIICSPPPEYMENCRTMYDPTDSCCPTYICDHKTETIPPQPHSQMSGTESPAVPSIQCHGDDCEVSGVDKQTEESPEPCASGSCPSQTDENLGGDVSKPVTTPPVKSCEGDECLSEPVTSPPVKSCEGDECISEPVTTPPVKSCEGDECLSEPFTSPPVKSCEGDECLSEPVTTPPVKSCEGDECASEPVTSPPIKSCEGDDCISEPVTSPPVKSCEGDDCISEPVTTPPVKSCEGDECISEPVTSPPVKSCEGDECISEPATSPPVKSCEGDECISEPVTTPPVKSCEGDECISEPVTSPPVTSCEGDECISEPVTSPPVKSCEGDECISEPVTSPPVKSCEGDDCISEPVTSPPITSCEGDECKTTIDETSPDLQPQPCAGLDCIIPAQEHDISKETCQGDEECKKQEVPFETECKDDSCRRKDSPAVDQQIPVQCSGPECPQTDISSDVESTTSTVSKPITSSPESQSVDSEYSTDKPLTEIKPTDFSELPDETSDKFDESISTTARLELPQESTTTKRIVDEELITIGTTELPHEKEQDPETTKVSDEIVTEPSITKVESTTKIDEGIKTEPSILDSETVTETSGHDKTEPSKMDGLDITTVIPDVQNENTTPDENIHTVKVPSPKPEITLEEEEKKDESETQPEVEEEKKDQSETQPGETYTKSPEASAEDITATPIVKDETEFDRNSVSTETEGLVDMSTESYKPDEERTTLEIDEHKVKETFTTAATKSADSIAEVTLSPLDETTRQKVTVEAEVGTESSRPSDIEPEMSTLSSQVTDEETVTIATKVENITPTRSDEVSEPVEVGSASESEQDAESATEENKESTKLQQEITNTTPTIVSQDEATIISNKEPQEGITVDDVRDSESTTTKGDKKPQDVTISSDLDTTTTKFDESTIKQSIEVTTPISDERDKIVTEKIMPPSEETEKSSTIIEPSEKVTTESTYLIDYNPEKSTPSEIASQKPEDILFPTTEIYDLVTKVTPAIDNVVTKSEEDTSTKETEVEHVETEITSKSPDAVEEVTTVTKSYDMEPEKDVTIASHDYERPGATSTVSSDNILVVTSTYDDVNKETTKIVEDRIQDATPSSVDVTTQLLEDIKTATPLEITKEPQKSDEIESSSVKDVGELTTQSTFELKPEKEPSSLEPSEEATTKSSIGETIKPSQTTEVDIQETISPLLDTSTEPTIKTSEQDNMKGTEIQDLVTEKVTVPTDYERKPEEQTTVPSASYDITEATKPQEIITTVSDEQLEATTKSTAIKPSSVSTETDIINVTTPKNIAVTSETETDLSTTPENSKDESVQVTEKGDVELEIFTTQSEAEKESDVSVTSPPKTDDIVPDKIPLQSPQDIETVTDVEVELITKASKPQDEMPHDATTISDVDKSKDSTTTSPFEKETTETPTTKAEEDNKDIITPTRTTESESKPTQAHTHIHDQSTEKITELPDSQTPTIPQDVQTTSEPLTDLFSSELPQESQTESYPPLETVTDKIQEIEQSKISTKPSDIPHYTESIPSTSESIEPVDKTTKSPESEISQEITTSQVEVTKNPSENTSEHVTESGITESSTKGLEETFEPEPSATSLKPELISESTEVEPAEPTSVTPQKEQATTSDDKLEKPDVEMPTDKQPDIVEASTLKPEAPITLAEEYPTTSRIFEGPTTTAPMGEPSVSPDVIVETTPEVQSVPVSLGTDSDKTITTEETISVQTEKVPELLEKPAHKPSDDTTAPEEDRILSTTKATPTKAEEEIATTSPADKFTKPEEKPMEPEVTPIPEQPKPITSDVQPTDELPPPEEDAQFPPSGPNGYGDQDYMEEDQTFGPGTCRYGGKVYVSAQQIPRDDPCDFCFCFRSDIICLQQSCPPPIHGCHEEPIQGFCCPRYECPVSMATTVNVTTTTTTTTTTLPPHFPIHSYKGSAQRKGCLIKGQSYKVGDVVRSSSGPCLHCTCGGDGQMKCDPKACTPEPMLRQMIAAAVSAKRRR